MDGLGLATALSVMSMLEESEMNTNNFEAQKNTMAYGKAVTRKTVDVSNRVYRQESLKRVK